MRILNVNTFDSEGGAARAVARLHQGLIMQGHESIFFAQQHKGSSATPSDLSSRLKKVSTRAASALDSLPLLAYRRRTGDLFSPAVMPDKLALEIHKTHPDIVHLHWLQKGFVRSESLRDLQRPVVWTFHDMWPITGGCHYTGNCSRFVAGCGRCPVLGSNTPFDLSRLNYLRKVRSLKGEPITVITPSRWMQYQVSLSPLFKDNRVEVIPNGLDTSIYKQFPKQIAREALSINSDKRIILFGAMDATSDRRKGFSHLLPALRRLAETEWRDRLQVLIFGSSPPSQDLLLGLETKYIGRLHDDYSLSLLYSAADVMITPSIQETFGQTASEALSCGTPVVAFNDTGIADIVDHQVNGYLISPQAESLDQGIRWILEDETRWNQLSIEARRKAERSFSLRVVADKHLRLYQDILSTFAAAGSRQDS